MHPSLAILFHRIGPYHFARLRAAGRSFNTTVLEMSGKDNTYAWEKVEGSDSFKRITLFDEDSRAQPASEIIRRVHAALGTCKPDAVVVNGWADTEAFAAYQWCLKKNIPAVVMSESTEWDEHRVSWKEWIKRRIVNLCSAALVGGTPHSDYLVKLGMPRDRVFMGYDAIDNDHFSTGSDKARADSQAIRTKYKLPDRYFLASARFVEKKNLSRLLEAYARYRELISALPHSESHASGPSASTSDPKSQLSAFAISAFPPLPAQTAPCSSPSFSGLSETASVHCPLSTANSEVSAFQHFSVSAFKDTPPPWSLVLLGDGPLKSTLISQIHALDTQPSTPPLRSGERAGVRCPVPSESTVPSSSPSALSPLHSVSAFQHFSVSDFVLMPGFVQYPDLPAYYGLASAFIHASTTEQWGLVVNEAMASGLPVLVSNRCGCAQDLVQEGVNGFTFDPCDVEQLAHLMLKLSTAPGSFPSALSPSHSVSASQHFSVSAFKDAPCSATPFQLSAFPISDLPASLPAHNAPCSDAPISASQHFSVSAFGLESRRIISNWGPERFATGLKLAVNAALSVPPPKATLLDRVLLNLLLHRRPRADN